MEAGEQVGRIPWHGAGLKRRVLLWSQSTRALRKSSRRSFDSGRRGDRHSGWQQIEGGDPGAS